VLGLTDGAQRMDTSIYCIVDPSLCCIVSLPMTPSWTAREVERCPKKLQQMYRPSQTHDLAVSSTRISP
jgi:hypothetical protein